MKAAVGVAGGNRGRGRVMAEVWEAAEAESFYQTWSFTFLRVAEPF